jgi:hypothetical protein
MALLGVNIDLAKGIVFTQTGLTTLQHSLGTTPDTSFPILRSVQASTAYPALLNAGANASLVTVGAQQSSLGAASFPTGSFDNITIYFWSAIR